MTRPNHDLPFGAYRHICSDTLYVHSDPDSVPSFAEECSLGIGHRIHATKKIIIQAYTTDFTMCRLQKYSYIFLASTRVMTPARDVLSLMTSSPAAASKLVTS